MSDDRPTLSVKRKQVTRQLINEGDWVKQGGQKEFLRILFTILDTAGMFTGNYQSDSRNHAMSEGRRSLGLDILRTAEKYLGPDALLQVLEAERSTLKEAPYDRSGTDYDDERNRDLGLGDDVREPGTGLKYLDYGTGADQPS